MSTSNEDSWRIPKTISIRSDQDAWLNNALGEKGNHSAFIRGLLDLVISGQLKPEAVRESDPKTALERAKAYMRAKEAALNFEEDVRSAVSDILARSEAEDLKSENSKVFNGSGITYVADIVILNKEGNVMFSIDCKSSSQPERLELALGEAIIGKQKTGAPVFVVVPYLLENANSVKQKFKAVGAELVEIANLPERIEAVVGGNAKGRR